MKPTQKIAAVLTGLCLLSGLGLLLYSPVQTAAQARENRRVIAGFEEYIHLETVPRRKWTWRQNRKNYRAGSPRIGMPAPRIIWKSLKTGRMPLTLKP